MLKIAASLARFGFNSLIYEAPGGRRRQADNRGSAAQVRSAAPPQTGKALPAPWHLRWRHRALAADARAPLPHLAFAVWLAVFAWRFLLVAILRIPRADLYYLHEYSLFPAAWVRSKLHGGRIIYDAHDFYSGIARPQDRTPFQRLYAAFGRRIEASCIRSAHGFVAVADGIAELYEAHFGRRPIVLRNSHDARLEDPPGMALRERLRLSPATKLAVIVGQAKPGQQLDGVLGAMTALTDLHLALIGNGYAERFGARIGGFGLHRRVHFVPDVPACQVVPLIRGADLSLIVYRDISENYRSALPNGFFQSIAAGLPLIYGPLPELSRICRQYGFGTEADPADCDQLRAALGRALDDRAWYQAERARTAAAAGQMSWQHDEARLRQLLHEIGLADNHADLPDG